MRKTVLAFGEVLWDLLPSGPALGGAPLNFACRIGSLGHHAIMVSRVGADDLGERALAMVEQLGVDTRFIERDGHNRTGRVKVHFGPAGEPDYEIVPDVAYDFIEATDPMLQVAGRADCVCFGTLVQRAQRSARTLREVLAAAPAALKLLDINLRRDCHTPHTINESLQAADVLRLNRDEARHLAELAAFAPDDLVALLERIRTTWSLTHCVLTLGAAGSLAVDATGQRVYVPGFEVAVVDTVGAGDAFSAGFTDQLLRGHPLADACRFANALGALVAGQKGATEPVELERIAQFIASAPPRVTEPALADLATP